MSLFISLLFAIPLFFILFQVTTFIRDGISHRKNINKINNFRKFTVDILKSVEEIKDPSIKEECSSFLLEKLVVVNKSEMYKMDISAFESEIYQRWGKHIPSYIKSQRDRKITDLGI
jgi:hypothetical protein